LNSAPNGLGEYQVDYQRNYAAGKPNREDCREGATLSRMLSNRYIYDGKPILSLNELKHRYSATALWWASGVLPAV